MAFKDGFVIEYAQPLKKNPTCKDCVYADLNDKCCNKQPIVFWEDGYGHYKKCDDFKVKESFYGKKHKEKTTSKTSKSVHSIKPSKTKAKKMKMSYEEINKERIRRAIRKDMFDDQISLFDDVLTDNFIELWDVKGQSNKCICGGKLIYFDYNKVYFRIKDKPAFVYVTGKYCKECKRMFIVKDVLIKSIMSV